VQDTAAGNPWYARELGQAAPRDGAAVGLGRPLPVPRRLRALLLEQVRALPESARRTLLVASAAARPTLTLLRAAGLHDPAADLAQAERLGMATADAEGTVRFRHPLVRAAVYADAPEQDRREAHALLTRPVTEPVEHARHLALAHPYEDEATARTLMYAAEYARRDGAPDAAFELAGLAARRTPGDRAAEHADRLLMAAEYACDAGQLEEAGQAAETVLTGSGSARQRVRARLVLLRNAGPRTAIRRPRRGCTTGPLYGACCAGSWRTRPGMPGAPRGRRPWPVTPTPGSGRSPPSPGCARWAVNRSPPTSRWRRRSH
jgi:hypothetical protein